MRKINDTGLNAQIIEQALNFGASVAGIASVEALKNSPLHVVFEKLITSKKGGYFSKMQPSWLVWDALVKII